MSIKRKWLLAIGLLMGTGALLGGLISTSMLYASAERMAYEWLLGEYRVGRARSDQMHFERLEREGRLLASGPAVASALQQGDPQALEQALAARWSALRPDDELFWMAQTPSGERFGSGTHCVEDVPSRTPAAEGPDGARRYALCGETPVMLTVAGEKNAPFQLFTGMVLGDDYVDGLEGTTASHVALISAVRTHAITLTNEAGERTPVELGELEERGERGVRFGKVGLHVPGKYAGYPRGRGHELRGNGLVEAFVLTGPLNPESPDCPLRLAFMVPSALIEEGAMQSGLAKGVLMVVLFSVLLFIAWRLVVNLTTPLLALGEATAHVADGDFSIRVPVRGDDEVARVGAAFNEMVAQLGESRSRLIQSERMAAIAQLARGMAHEINNPLAVGQVNLEALDGHAKWFERLLECRQAPRHVTGPSEAEAGREVIQEMVEVTEEITEASRRIAGLVADFTHITEPHHDRNVEDVEPDSIVRACLDEELGFERPAFLEIEGEPVASVDADDLRLVVRNVLAFLGQHGAMNSPSARGPVTVRCKALPDGRVSLSVTDPSLELTEQQRQRILDPHVRPVTSKATGMRLDLAMWLAYQTLRRNDGDLSVDRGLPGTRFLIHLPGSPARSARS